MGSANFISAGFIAAKFFTAIKPAEIKFQSSQHFNSFINMNMQNTISVHVISARDQEY